MAEEKKDDHWSSEAYQHSASFVPKLATKVVQWLDVQPDDVILDIGCGDGVLDRQILEVLKTGKGSLCGVDSSPAMIDAAIKSVRPMAPEKSSFEVLDANALIHHPQHQSASYTKVFSNAAMHWILAPPSNHEDFFLGVRRALTPNGVLVFEMGGLGNCAEMRAALLSAVGRRVGLDKAVAADPWFFPDEEWMKDMLEARVGGFKVEKVEREWRPTTADEGGVEGWVRLMGRRFFEVVEDVEEREECVKEVAGVLKVVCAASGGREMINYVRLRCVARRVG